MPVYFVPKLYPHKGMDPDFERLLALRLARGLLVTKEIYKPNKKVRGKNYVPHMSFATLQAEERNGPWNHPLSLPHLLVFFIVKQTDPDYLKKSLRQNRKTDNEGFLDRKRVSRV